MLYPALNKTVDQLLQEFGRIPSERKQVLHQLADLVRDKAGAGQLLNLNFICTHNSRRSHMAQLWAQAAAHYYHLSGIRCFSGGTEATAFDPRAIRAMQEAGFEIVRIGDGDNPHYEVRFAAAAPPVISFSKRYDDPVNVRERFVAVMTCSQADENCPLVAGADARIVVSYDDPKNADGSPAEAAVYHDSVRRIGREVLYVFSLTPPHRHLRR